MEADIITVKGEGEFTTKQLDLFVKMLEMYLEWAETVPEIAGEEK